MKTYLLVFKVTSKIISIPIMAEVIYGNTSLSYKALVDLKISEWLRSNKLNAKSTKVLDIFLLNESKEQVFIQKDWSDYTTIIHNDFNEETNSDLIEKLELDDDFDF